MAKAKENYLDYIPRLNKNFEWEVKEDGLVEIKRENKGFYNFLAQKLFKRPRFSYIKLEEFGSFIWQQIDGVKNIYEIGQALEKQFGDKAKPVYERLSTYMKTLHDEGFIVYENKIRK